MPSPLDELPSLVNIIKSDLSIVGPRPLLIEYLPYYTEEERSRHTVRPGLTGWAQVNGRNTVEWSKRFALDTGYRRISDKKAEYIENGLVVYEVIYDTEGNPIEGLINDYLYIDGVRIPQYYGLVKYDGALYYVSDGAKVVKNVTGRYINKTNGLTYADGTQITNGTYDFDADGKMVIKNGVVGDYLYIGCI